MEGQSLLPILFHCRITAYSWGVLIVVGFLPAILWRLRGHPLAYYFDESFSPSQLIDVLIIPFGLFLLFHLAPAALQLSPAWLRAIGATKS